jgi:hypothetical protein
MATSGDDPRERPLETIAPLATRLRLTPITRYSLGSEEDLVKEVVALTGVALVSWEHKAIYQRMLPKIANGPILHKKPTGWEGSRFDVVFRFDRSIPDASWSFRQLFPRMLSGDSDIPLK